MRTTLWLCIAMLALTACEGAALNSSPVMGDGASNDGAVAEIPEQCDNGLDDDRDGEVDEGCGCTTDEVQPCYGGDPAKAGKGICKLGEQQCEGTTEFKTWGSCTGWVAPETEVSGNGIDEDCDGSDTAGSSAAVCGELTRISSTESGGPAERPTWVSDISRTGQHVVMVSTASRIGGLSEVTTDDGHWRLLVHDLSDGSNDLIASDVPLWDQSWWGAVISEDGQHVAHYTVDPTVNLPWKLVVFDRQADTQRTIDTPPTDYNHYWWGHIDLSSDGRFVSYFNASATTSWQLMVHDKTTKASNEIATGGDLADCWWGAAAMTPDGRYVAYHAPAATKWKIVLHDREANSDTVVATIDRDPSYCWGWGLGIAVSDDARYVAYHQTTGPASDINTGEWSWKLILHDTSGKKDQVVVSTQNPAWDWHRWGSKISMSGDGRYLTYHVLEDPADPTWRWPLSVYDRTTGSSEVVANQTLLQAKNSGVVEGYGAWSGIISADGRCIAYSGVGELSDDNDVTQAYVTPNPLFAP